MQLDEVSLSAELANDAMGATSTSWISSSIFCRITKGSNILISRWLDQAFYTIRLNYDFTTINYLIGLMNSQVSAKNKKKIIGEFSRFPFESLPGSFDILHFINRTNGEFTNIFQIKSVHSQGCSKLSFDSTPGEISLLQNVSDINCFILWNLNCGTEQCYPFVLNLAHLKSYSNENTLIRLIFQDKENKHNPSILQLGEKVDVSKQVSIDIKLLHEEFINKFEVIVTSAIKRANDRIFSTEFEHIDSEYTISEMPELQVADSFPTNSFNIYKIARGLWDNLSDPISQSSIKSTQDYDKNNLNKKWLESEGKEEEEVINVRNRRRYAFDTQEPRSSSLTDISEDICNSLFLEEFRKKSKKCHFAVIRNSNQQRPSWISDDDDLETRIFSEDVGQSRELMSEDFRRHDDTTITSEGNFLSTKDKTNKKHPQFKLENEKIHESVKEIGQNLIREIQKRDKLLVDAFEEFESSYRSNIEKLDKSKNELNIKYAQIIRRARNENDKVTAEFQKKIDAINNSFL